MQQKLSCVTSHVRFGVTGEEKPFNKNDRVLLPMSNSLKAVTATHLVIGSSAPCV